MGNKMLIDAAHPEETRVVVLRGNRIEEFDFEAANKKQLRGNIYLAKVTRVEPSLQAAFVEYGGNRHGFLAFSEIHPDYYQIPQADRAALLKEDAAAKDDRTEAEIAEEAADAKAAEDAAAGDTSAEDQAGDDRSDEEGEGEDNGTVEVVGDDDTVESIGNEDALEEIPTRRQSRARSYKIQEVIKRRQIILVQVVKEERGNKGAALTTYLSLAGRYSVLMPNTARGGGISRKITNAADRKRLKEIASDLEVPDGMGVILRTAGANRTKTEVKRDFEYLMRLWESVRDLTLKSSAPNLVYEEGSLIKRSIRDLYNRDIDEVLVSGEDGYREAKDFMRMLMPSHAKNVQPYREAKPLFARAGIEDQLESMVSPTVTLKSGGYLVINQTEALVSIDVNSGRSTREHNIEDTALHTNLEAADEVARQLRLRDLAGLIVIDFIDMEEKRNNRAVERRMKEALKTDRARIQVGRISHFGLLEMSRQRIRSSVLESTMDPCPHCGGTGHVRSPSSVALQVLRTIEEALQRSQNNHLLVKVRTPVALYILNQKRNTLSELEERFGPSVTIIIDDTLSGQPCLIAKGDIFDSPRPAMALQPDSLRAARDAADREADAAAEAEAAAAEEISEPEGEEDEDDTTAENGEDNGRSSRRRRRRRGGRGRNGERNGDATTSAEAGDEAGDTLADGETDSDGEDSGDGGDTGESAEGDADGEAGARGEGRRRRGRRGGRRRRGRRGDGENGESEAGDGEVSGDDAGEEPAAAVDAINEPVAAEDAAPVAQPVAVEDSAAEMPAAVEAQAHTEEPAAPVAVTDVAVAQEAPVAEASSETAPSVEASEEAPAGDAAESVSRETGSSEEADDGRPKRSGWWQKRSFF